MSYKEQVYKIALDQILELYKESRYNKDVDLFRIVDIINSVNDNQFKNKEWLIEKSLKYINDQQNILVAGSWYGLLGRMLTEKNIDAKILLVDSDPFSKELAKKFNPSENVKSKCNDVVDYFIQVRKKITFDVIINTSCEHMEKSDIQLINKLKPKDSVVILQSNNYTDVNSHVNTSNSLEEFVSYLKLSEVLFKDTLVTDNYERYMVIGK